MTNAKHIDFLQDNKQSCKEVYKLALKNRLYMYLIVPCTLDVNRSLKLKSCIDEKGELHLGTNDKCSCGAQ